MNNHRSDLARIVAQIDAEAQAAWNALYGPMQGNAKHAFITARYDRLGQLREQLTSIVGKEGAMRAVADAMDRYADNGFNPRFNPQ
jgi:hypothetical protein